MFSLRFRTACFMVASLSAASCSPAGPATSDVSGSVTADGKPIGTGLIRFITVGHENTSSNARIVDGRYAAERVIVGQTKVSISWIKSFNTKPGADPSDTAAFYEEGLPAKYNKNTVLTADIKGPADAVDFPLTTK